MDLLQARLAMAGFLAGMIIFAMFAAASESVIFVVLTVICSVGYIVCSFFNRCPNCGHWLGRHHWFIEFCPYCGNCL